MDNVSSDILMSFSGTSEQRIQAIFHQLFDNSNNSINILCNTLQYDPSPIVRHEAAYILGEKHNPLAVDVLIKVIETDSHKIVIHESALALANLGNIAYPKSEHTLQKLLQYPDEDVVDTVEIALQRLDMKMTSTALQNDQKILESILANTAPENKEKRIQASFLLMDNASTESVDLLLQSLHREPSSIVKHELIFSLGECIDYRVVPELMKVLKIDSNFFSVHESLLALGTIGDSQAEPSIRNFLSHSDPGISESAEIALERLLS